MIAGTAGMPFTRLARHAASRFAGVGTTGAAGARGVRVFVQDVLQPLEFCGGDAHGVCTLDAFVASQAYARHDGEGDFEKCFANTTGP